MKLETDEAFSSGTYSQENVGSAPEYSPREDKGAIGAFQLEWQ